MASIDDIWDEPLAPASPPIQQNRADDDAPGRSSNRPRSSLFLDSDSENDTASASKLPPGIDDLFNDLDTPDEVLQDLTPALDLDALRREASMKHANNPASYEIPPSSSPHKGGGGDGGDKEKGREKDETKKRKAIPRLDEGRLLSPDGIPALMKEAKRFKIKGKGHEASDLNRLLTVYQYWAHQLYPRNQFSNTIDRVEKLCHSRRMHVALSVWYDESKGLIHGKQPEEIVDVDPDSDGEDPNHTLPAQGEQFDLPSRPPSSASERSSNNDDGLDIDAMIREDEARQQQTHASSSTGPQANNQTTNDINGFDNEFDVAMWEDFAFADDPPIATSRPPPTNPPPKPLTNENQDEDMWDLVNELEAGTTTSAAGEKEMETDPPAPELTAPPSDVDDWDDMYA